MAPIVPILAISAAGVVCSTVIGWYTQRGLSKIHDEQQHPQEMDKVVMVDPPTVREALGCLHMAICYAVVNVILRITNVVKRIGGVR